MRTRLPCAAALALAAPFLAPADVRAQAKEPARDAAPEQAPGGEPDREIVLPRSPRISPDGSLVAFAWRGDVWIAPSRGGAARRITSHPADDDNPVFHPDGASLAFVSDRTGRNQVFLVELQGGAPRQVTADSNGYQLLGFAEAGRSLLLATSSDRHFHGSESRRLYLFDLQGERPKRMLFDAGFSTAALSPDGTKVLFTRGRSSWWRKGYRGAAAEQIWLADLAQEPVALRRLGSDLPDFQNVSETDPMWAPDGKGYWFVADPDGTFDVWFRELAGDAARRVTDVAGADGSDDGVAFPSVSADGKAMIVRRRFRLQHVDVASGSVTPVRIEASGDRLAGPLERRVEDGAATVAFTPDGKQMAFVAGEDVYVMDRVLREPVRVTATPSRETDLVFAADGRTLWFVSDAGGEMDVWRTTCPREDGIWWLASDFALEQVTDDRAVEEDLTLSPQGDRLAFVKDRALWVMGVDGSDPRMVVATWSGPDYDWSPDGKWFTYATQDDDYNNDVWIAPLDGSRPPFNVSRHPGREGDPVWSPDGKRIAFVGQRDGEESDVYYVNLTKEDEEKTGRDRRLEEALAAMKKKDGGAARNAAGRRGRRGGDEPRPGDPPADPPADPPVDPPADPPAAPAGTDEPAGAAAAEDAEAGEKDEKDEKPVVVTIDFDGLLDRMHRIPVRDSREGGLLWSPDGKKLAFSATVDGERGLYTVEFPDVERPKRLARTALGRAAWLEQTKEIVGLASSSSSEEDGGGPRGRGRFGGGGGGGVPAALSARGELERFPFSTRQTRDWVALRQLAFDQGWRAMRDRFYDEAMNNRDWEAVRAKYRPMAARCLGRAEFSELMNMMLGELNASHMGHRPGDDPLPRVDGEPGWSPVTYQLGLRFEPADGAGLTVASVIPNGPCAQARSRVEPGEVLLAVDGTALDGSVDIDELLTLDDVRDVELRVRGAGGTERTVTVRPVASVRGLLYDEWVDGNRALVEKASGGRLGYLHIRGMNMPSVRQMEEDFFAAGHDKDGLIIDVRFNGGGSTADHVLTMLTQPVHAITVSRRSGQGYPVDRKVYASWGKPIVLMCNEYSFSNAEILSHAVKQLGRGRLVGMRTGGGVISTGSQGLVDGSSVRMPTRGWYLVTTGEDMELNGCLPHVALWNDPLGPDQQLARAVEMLQEDVAAELARGRPEPVPAAARRRQAAAEASTTGNGQEGQEGQGDGRD